MHKVVILGGGYGGMTLAQELLEDLPPDTELTMVERMPYQGLKTEYYALAAGTVSDIDLRVQFPVHKVLQMVYGVIEQLDLKQRLVMVRHRDPVPYDSLIIALGCTDNYHGIPGAPEFSCSIQSLSATRRTYRELNDIRPYGQVTIVGGGLSGVELASELRESRKDINIRILDRGASVLSAFPGALQEYVASWFRLHDVEMRGHIGITSLERGVIHNGDEPIPTDAAIWTAGIQPVELVQKLALPKDPQGRLIVNHWHELPDFPHVYVIGDCSSQPFSPSAQLAQAQGKQVAEVISSRLRGKEPRLGKVRLKGVLGSLGKKAGFGIMGATPLLGRIPRLIKSGVLWRSKRHFG